MLNTWHEIGQDCLIDEYDLMMEQVEKFVDEQHLDINLLPPYKRDVFYRFIKNHYSKQDILSLYYFNDEIGALECFIDMIDSKYQ